MKSDSSNTNINWTKIHKIVEYKKIFAIYIALNKAFLIPKYIVENKLDILREIFKNNLDKKKLKLRKNYVIY